MLDEIYHTCRWCKWYKDGFCCSRSFESVDLYDFREIELRCIIGARLGDSDAGNSLYDSISEALIKFENALTEKTGIVDPDTFFCKDFWE